MIRCLAKRLLTALGRLKGNVKRRGYRKKSALARERGALSEDWPSSVDCYDLHKRHFSQPNY